MKEYNGLNLKDLGKLVTGATRRDTILHATIDEGMFVATNSHWLFRVPESILPHLKINRNKVPDLPSEGRSIFLRDGEYMPDPQMPNYNAVVPRYEGKTAVLTPWAWDMWRCCQGPDGIIMVDGRYAAPLPAGAQFGIDDDTRPLRYDVDGEWVFVLMPAQMDPRMASLVFDPAQVARARAWSHVCSQLPGLGSDEEINGGDVVDALNAAVQIARGGN